MNPNRITKKELDTLIEEARKRLGDVTKDYRAEVCEVTLRQLIQSLMSEDEDGR